MEKRNNKYHIIYGIMVAVVILMVVWVLVKEDGESLGVELSKDCIAFNTGWVLEDGSGADIAKLNNIPDVEPYKEISVYNKLPKDLEEGLYFCFRSKNIFYQVYVDGELRYNPDVPESRIYNDSFGTRWNYVPLCKKDAGKEVKVNFYTVYENSRACLDYLYLGTAAGNILNIFSGKMVAFISCLLLIFVSCLLIVADIPINMQVKKNHELMYLGLFSMSIAIWCMSETNLLQFFTNDSRLLQIVSCCSLILIPIPMVLYLDAAFGFRKRIILPVICYMSAAEFLICTLLHFAKVKDYHDMLRFSHIMLGISTVILIVTIIRNSFHLERNRVKNIYNVFRAIGLMSLGFAAVIDIIRYYCGNSGDSAMFVRIGLLIFIICYGSSSLEKTIKAVKLGVQTEFVSQLAYRDGLTGVGNRTAFQEYLAELEKERDSIEGVGIVMFDVNDLKYVNDNLGHQKGDDMLVHCADLIRNAFEMKKGSCFRIGGDEFAVIISGENVSERCEQGISLFKSAMEEYNEVPEQPFRISIASGFAVYNRNQGNEKLMDIYKLADGRMYENKKKIKAAQTGPEEYYAKRA